MAFVPRPGHCAPHMILRILPVRDCDEEQYVYLPQIIIVARHDYSYDTIYGMAKVE